MTDDPRASDYEPVAVNVRMPVFLALGLAALLGSTLVGLWWLDRLWSPPALGPETITPDSKHVPRERWSSDAPLSARQRQERLDYESEQETLLSSYGWIDRDAGVARIPIARAMELLQQRAEAKP
jgi:hypothetical protein